MGQNYRAFVWTKDAVVTVVDPSDRDGGKLMEHSILGSDITNSIMAGIYNNPYRIAWVGEYAKEEECARLGFNYNDNVWGNNVRANKPDFSGVYLAKYIVNHTKMEYVDFFCYIYDSGAHFKDQFETVIHPLPLLTAVGNGRGSGDYDKRFPYSDIVGRWAGDVISCENEHPAVSISSDFHNGFFCLFREEL